MNSNLVSIITPLYNSGEFISQTIESVLSQTYENWEIIIIDDVSTDHSNKIITEYIKKDKRIKLIQLEKNSGPAVARNKAIEEAKGRYIAFLDADDLWLPTKLEKQIKFMTQNDIVLSYTAYYKITEEGEELGVIQPPDKVSYKKMLKSNFIACFTAIYDAKNIGKVFMPVILKRQDYALWLKILKKIDFAYAVKEPLGYYRVRRNNSVSSNKLFAAIYHWKVYREVEKMNLFSSIYYFMHYAIRGYIKFKK